MELHYCEELFTREEVSALFKDYIRRHPEHDIKPAAPYPYYLGGPIGAWCADVHNFAFEGVLVLDEDKEVYLQWQYTTGGDELAL